jgi:hypothetical protein
MSGGVGETVSRSIWKTSLLLDTLQYFRFDPPGVTPGIESGLGSSTKSGCCAGARKILIEDNARVRYVSILPITSIVTVLLEDAKSIWYN